MGGEERSIPVKAKAVLIDAESMAIVWMNESASEGLDTASIAAVSIDQVVPLAESLGVPEALRSVAETGCARHLATNLVSTTSGNVTVVTSIYRLPDGMLLVLSENAWQPTHKATDGGSARRSARRAR